MKRSINVLVMAAGSPLGQSIYKALTISALPLNVYLADISEMAAGFYLHQHAARNIILPMVMTEAYFAKLKEVIRKFNIEVIFPVISVEHDFFSGHIDYFNANDINIITPEKSLYDLCNDKYLSMAHLKDKGIKTPDTELCEDNERVEAFLGRNDFPVVMKPRYGASSQNFFVIQDRQQMLAIANAFPSNYFVVQEYLPANREYTVGVYISMDHSFKKTFIIDRELKFGLSYKGEVIIDKRISDYCLTLCSVLGMTYSTNVQLKVVNGEPCVFEINPRLSSTTAVRANFGFNEPEMILWELFDNISEYIAKFRTGKFMRYWEEVYVGEK